MEFDSVVYMLCFVLFSMNLLSSIVYVEERCSFLSHFLWFSYPKSNCLSDPSMWILEYIHIYIYISNHLCSLRYGESE